MTCAEFLDRFSDYYDGLLQPAEAARLDRHKAECPSCEGYARVLDQSLGLLRELPVVEPRDDFKAGIQYRIHHEDELELVGLGPLGSAAATRTVALVAVMLAFTAWAPSLVRPASNGVRALAAARGLAVAPVGDRANDATEYEEIELAPFSAGQLGAPDEEVKQLWIYPNAMLYEYSTLGGRNRWRAEQAQDAFVRAVGLE